MPEAHRVTAILGSPRRGGNSDTLALEFLRGVESRGLGYSLIIPTDLGVGPCDGNNRCFTDGRCVIRDGMNEIYETILATKYLLIATPVYFMGPPGSLKSFIDRFQAVWARSAVLKAFAPDSPERRADHKAFVMITAATPERPSMYRPALSIVKAFLNVTGFDFAGRIIVGGLEGEEDARTRPDLLKQAFTAGAQFVR